MKTDFDDRYVMTLGTPNMNGHLYDHDSFAHDLDGEEFTLVLFPSNGTAMGDIPQTEYLGKVKLRVEGNDVYGDIKLDPTTKFSQRASEAILSGYMPASMGYGSIQAEDDGTFTLRDFELTGFFLTDQPSHVKGD